MLAVDQDVLWQEISVNQPVILRVLANLPEQALEHDACLAHQCALLSRDPGMLPEASPQGLLAQQPALVPGRAHETSRRSMLRAVLVQAAGQRTEAVIALLEFRLDAALDAAEIVKGGAVDPLDQRHLARLLDTFVTHGHKVGACGVGTTVGVSMQPSRVSVRIQSISDCSSASV